MTAATDTLSVPPHSVEAEQSVIGALLIDADAWHNLRGLAERHFYRYDHQLIFRAIAKLRADDKPTDTVTVAEALESAGHLDRAGGLPYIASLAEHTPSAANVTAYAEIVMERALSRFAMVALDDGQQLLRSGRKASDVLPDIQSRFESLMRGAVGESLNFAQVIERGLERATLAFRQRKLRGLAGAPTGIHRIDEDTGGLHGPRLWIVAGRPGLGKTALTLQWVLVAATQGHPVGVISLEMGADEIALRAVANRFRLCATGMALGDAEHHESLKQVAAAGRLSEFKRLPIHLDTDTLTLPGIISRVTEWRRVHKIAFAVVDHIGLIEGAPGAFNTRTEQLGQISRSLKNLAKRLGVPIIAVSQLNRSVEKERRRPVLADLRDSGNLEQDADIVLMLHNSDDGPDIELGLLKNRAGAKGWLPGAVRFDGRTQRFTVVPSTQTEE